MTLKCQLICLAPAGGFHFIIITKREQWYNDDHKAQTAMKSVDMAWQGQAAQAQHFSSFPLEGNRCAPLQVAHSISAIFQIAFLLCSGGGGRVSQPQIIAKYL